MKTTLLIMAAGIGSRFGTGIKQLEPVDYAFQDINDIPGTLPEGRTKPWGTGQAVLAAKKVIKTPFIVINADDYYGKEGFKAVHEYLVNGSFIKFINDLLQPSKMKYTFFRLQCGPGKNPKAYYITARLLQHINIFFQNIRSL